MASLYTYTSKVHLRTRPRVCFCHVLLTLMMAGGREENVARAVGLAQNLIQTVRDAYEEASKLRQQQLQQLQMVQVDSCAESLMYRGVDFLRRLLLGR
jgi:hypothetical protein